MTWLSLVTTVTLISGFVGMAVLHLLGLSLRAQEASTTKQAWNRRMLAAGICAAGAGIVIPFLALGWIKAAFFAFGWLALGILGAAMFASRVPTRFLATLLFLTAALYAVVRLPPSLGTFDAVGVFVVAGLVLAKVTRVAIRRADMQRRIS
jgi:hypothetical protein